MNKYLPGNPFDPIGAYTNERDQITDEAESEWISEMGQTDAVLIALNLKQVTHAVMALAFEQRTANLIAFRRDVLSEEHYDQIYDAICKRFGLEEK